MAGAANPFTSHEPLPPLEPLASDHALRPRPAVECADLVDELFAKAREPFARDERPIEREHALGCARRTVERKLALIEQCWAAEVGDELDG